MSKVNTAVIKALEVLDLLGQSDEPLHLKAIAQTLDYPESTVHRLLASLAAKGYVRQSYYNGRYHLGWKLVTLAQTLGSFGQLTKTLRPHLQDLLRQIDQTINLGALNDLAVIYLDSFSPPNRLAMYNPPGSLAPIHATAIGKVQLAFLPESELDALLPRLSFESYTPNTITSIPELRAELERIRECGYALDREEYFENTQCIATPIKDAQGKPIAGVSVTTLITDLPADWEEQYASVMLAACERMEHQLDG